MLQTQLLKAKVESSPSLNILTKALFKEFRINWRGLRILRTKTNRIRILVTCLTKYICESSKVSGYGYPYVIFNFLSYKHEHI